MLNIEDFFARQFSIWSEVAERFKALEQVEVKYVGDWKVQFNPARAVSTAAKVDSASIAARPCFLCAENRPENQLALDWEDMEILVNPYPIFPGHLTIASKGHTPQTLEGRAEQMCRLSRELPGYTIFFNGAKAGASAPDHMHFQAVPSKYIQPRGNIYVCYQVDDIYAVEWSDPMMNAVCNDGVITVIPRTKHRPDCYGEFLISPAAIDLCGTLIAVRREDFDRLDEKLVNSIIREVTFQEPLLYVGLLTKGLYRAIENNDGTFSLNNYLLGDSFHWERVEKRTFAGELILYNKTDNINRVGIEEYLKSVISSEMSAKSHAEFLKAHAVISRSWVLRQMRINRGKEYPRKFNNSPTEICHWYNNFNHDHFDVCSDDHCQRYQGIDNVTEAVADAVEQTRGLVLTCQGDICDARFSKCCGGAFERFENCWEPVPHLYLREGRDILPERNLPDLSTEAAAREWIISRPEAFCGEVSDSTLEKVLNDFDRETTPDFYRWTVRYTQDELSDIVAKRIKPFGMAQPGKIVDLRPLDRGTSGRIYRLEIVGENGNVIIGKELLIRKVLSRSHLYSSAFVVERDGTDFILRGAGWGHGVGLCQIGAAEMAERGYNYRQILSHYFPDTEISCIELWHAVCYSKDV